MVREVNGRRDPTDGWKIATCCIAGKLSVGNYVGSPLAGGAYLLDGIVGAKLVARRAHRRLGIVLPADTSGIQFIGERHEAKARVDIRGGPIWRSFLDGSARGSITSPLVGRSSAGGHGE